MAPSSRGAINKSIDGMSDHKNTILAVVLSLLVIVGWQYFVGYPQMERQRQEAQLKQQEQPQTRPGSAQPAQPGASQPSATPATPEVPATPKIAPPSGQPQTASREAVIVLMEGLRIETARPGVSIDLPGGPIDLLRL